MGLWSLEERRNRADIIEVFKWLKVGLQYLWNLCLSYLRRSIRGHKFKLVKHGCNLEVRRNFFTERLINTWNSLDQRTLQVDSVNCFKNHLQLTLEEYWDGFLR